MGKKCIPGVLCIENMTLFLYIVISILLIYVYYNYSKNINNSKNQSEKIVIITNNDGMSLNNLVGKNSRNDILNNPYSPPLKTEGTNLSLYYPRNSSDIRGIPVNIETRGIDSDYQQIGILTKTSGNSDIILPLMGRKIMSGRDKWQYYTISNTGNINTKLPISVNGKSCTSEYGCDDINNGDVVYVEGYKETFRATIYENNIFRYIPFI
jgi:hypothetical protein